ncbi:MAG: WG repeat-containing protein [Clostridia bacterium]|nr:WG repeat-containing protein [Clostridia bacterium]
MFKKIIAFVLACMFVFSFAGCMKEQSPDETTEQTTAETANQPDEQNKESSGMLVPYMAGYKYDEENGYWTERFYGLMTADGKKVVEPVYDWCRTLECNGKKYYCMQILDNKWEDTCYNSLLVSADGTWQLELEDNIRAVSENRIICGQLDGIFTVYDYDGNKIFSGNENQSVDTNGNGFYNGLLVVFDFLSDNGYTTVVDENGEVVLDKLDYCGPFITGKAVASYNRDEGYGIITPEGEWLLEPKYVDIAEVDGKYFIASDYDKEYIYDTELKLLREREFGWSAVLRSYFLEDDGKLVRYYANMYAPDEYYRDAFTDEIIACGDVYATECSEEYGFFYGTNDGEFCIFDVNGKCLNECENTERVTVYEGTYAAFASSVERVWFNAATHEEIITVIDDNDEKWTDVSTAGDLGVAVIAELEHKQDGRMDGPYHLYDYKNREYIFRDCEYCEINEFNGEVYITAVYKDRIEIYDADLNLLIETENLCEK